MWNECKWRNRHHLQRVVCPRRFQRGGFGATNEQPALVGLSRESHSLRRFRAREGVDLASEHASFESEINQIAHGANCIAPCVHVVCLSSVCHESSSIVRLETVHPLIRFSAGLCICALCKFPSKKVESITPRTAQRSVSNTTSNSISARCLLFAAAHLAFLA